ncbi:oxidation resistance protein 1 [Irineochytrium annulatum]|nr:oxidation resistance protein 1 [Irineochytrium annulatum]
MHVTRYSIYIPLHALWLNYITSLIPSSTPAPEVASKLAHADLHGAVLTVTKSRCPSLVRISGILIRETENVFDIVTRKDVVKRVPKAGSIFAFEVMGRIVTVFGDHYRCRAVERMGKKFKPKPTVELFVSAYRPADMMASALPPSPDPSIDMNDPIASAPPLSSGDAYAADDLAYPPPPEVSFIKETVATTTHAPVEPPSPSVAAAPMDLDAALTPTQSTAAPPTINTTREPSQPAAAPRPILTSPTTLRNPPAHRSNPRRSPRTPTTASSTFHDHDHHHMPRSPPYHAQARTFSASSPPTDLPSIQTASFSHFLSDFLSLRSSSANSFSSTTSLSSSASGSVASSLGSPGPIREMVGTGRWPIAGPNNNNDPTTPRVAQSPRVGGFFGGGGADRGRTVSAGVDLRDTAGAFAPHSPPDPPPKRQSLIGSLGQLIASYSPPHRAAGSLSTRERHPGEGPGPIDVGGRMVEEPMLAGSAPAELGFGMGRKVDDGRRPVRLVNPVADRRAAKGEEVEPTVLEEAVANDLRDHLPPFYRETTTWTLLYSLDTHGASMSTLYSSSHDHSSHSSNPCLLVIRSTSDRVFGGFLTSAPRLHPSHFGSGESFLFRVNASSADALAEEKVEVWHATGANAYFLYCDPGYLGMGGGAGKVGLWVCADLENGHSERCETFGNEPLAGEGGKFRILGLEVWEVGF